MGEQQTETKREKRIREQAASLGHNLSTPEVPPGVMTFDPRRLRRHSRKAGYLGAIREAQRAKREAEAHRDRLSGALAARVREEDDRRRTRQRWINRGSWLVAAALLVAILYVLIARVR